MEIRRVVFWQNIPSIHQSALVRALAETPGLEVWFAHEEDLPTERRAMGWVEPDFGRAHLVDSRDLSVWRNLIRMNDPSTAHAFGSYFLLPRAFAAFRRLRRSRCLRVWTTEAFDYHGWRGQVRLWRARWHVQREARAGFDLVFAMGDLGVGFFRRAGIPQAKLREFAYLVEPVEARVAERESGGRKHRFLFVGQMIPRKGVDLLLEALAGLMEADWEIELIGDGPERTTFETLAGRLGIAGRCDFRGNLSQADALEAIRAADTLVLPSRWDGWGAVVNEALMCGTRVVVSNACGSSSLIIDAACGKVFPRGNVAQLGESLRHEISGDATCHSRAALARWAGRSLSGAALARYFLGNLAGGPDHLPAPWRMPETPGIGNQR